MPQLFFRWSLSLIALGYVCLGSANAQSGLRESLEKLDRNENGKIEPEEITPLARPYLERVARARRMSLDRDNDIEEWQEASRIYFALQNGISDREVDFEDRRTVKRFGTRRSEVMVPEFGLPEVKYPYTREDLDEADRMLWRLDRNRDGYVDRDEARRGDWTHRDPFEEDMDGDSRLSRLELGQRYARRRILEGSAGELIQKSRRVGNGIRPTEPNNNSRGDDSRWWMRGGSRTWLTASMMSRFDANRNGRLEAGETANLGMPIGRIDIDLDGEISRDELQTHLEQLQDEAGDDSEGLPTWFFERDLNRDDQVEMSEFASDWTEDLLEEFAVLDINGDGILTTLEVVQSKAMMGGSYVNSEAVVLPPRKTVISEIVVDEDFVIADLNVEVSITHTHLAYLDLYLTGPDGQRIELCTEVGGSDDHFQRTVFDDQAEVPIVKGRAPFEGRFRPEGVLKGQPGLAYFNDRSTQGVWQLVVSGTRSERFGMLHSWSISMKSKSDSMDQFVAAVDEDVESPAEPQDENAEAEWTKSESSQEQLEKYRRFLKERGRVPTLPGG